MASEVPTRVASPDIGAVGRRAASFWRRWGPSLHPLWLLIAPVVLIIVGLFVTVFWLSALKGLPGTADARPTVDNYLNLYLDPFVVQALANTLGFAATSVAISLFFGITIAWLVERTDLPGKSVVYGAMTVGLLLPNFFLAMGWLFLLHPRIGAANHWIARLTGLSRGPFNITSVLGMGWIEGLGLAALAFILTSATFRSMDPALEEAAMIHGAPFSQMLRRVFLPLVFPGILASALYIFTIGFAAFDVPAIIGLSNRIYTFSTFVYTKSATAAGLPDYGSTAAMSSLLVVLAILSSLWYGRVIKQASQYQVVTGKGYRPRQTALGKWTFPAWLFIASYFVLSKLLPLLLVIWAASLPFFQPPSLKALGTLSFQNFQRIPTDLVARGASHTAILMIVVPPLALLVSAGFSWMIVRSRSPLRGVVDFFAFLPHAVPSIIFGVSALFVALFVLKALPLYGSLLLLAMVYVVVRLSFGTRLLNSALIQIHSELEEAAATSGATGIKTARAVLAPLVWPAVLNGWLWVALETYRELTLATVLYSPANITLPVVVWSIWSSGNLGVAAAVSLVLFCGLGPLILGYWVFARRQIFRVGAVSLR